MYRSEKFRFILERKTPNLLPSYINRSRSPSSSHQILNRSSSPLHFRGRSDSQSHYVRADSPAHYLEINESPPHYIDGRESSHHYLNRNGSPPRYIRRNGPSTGPTHFLNENESPPPYLERTVSPPPYLERPVSPHHLMEMSDYTSNYDRRDESPTHYLERNDSPPHYLEMSRSPPHYMGEGGSSPHYFKRDESPSRYIEKNVSTSLHMERSPYFINERNSPSHYLERNMSPDHLLERKQSPTHFEDHYFKRTTHYSRVQSQLPIPTVNYFESEKHNYSYADEQKELDSEEYHPDTFNSVPHEVGDVMDFKQFASQSDDSNRDFGSNEQINDIADSEIFRNDMIKKKVNSIKDIDSLTEIELHAFRLHGSSHKKAMLLYKEGMSYVEAKREIIKENFIRGQKNHDESLSGPHTLAESDTMFTNKSDDSNRDFSSNEQSNDIPHSKTLRNSMVKKKLNTIEDIDSLTEVELRAFRLRRSSHKKAMLLFKEGMSYVEAKREIIKENFIRGRKNHDESLSGPHIAESDTRFANKADDSNENVPQSLKTSVSQENDLELKHVIHPEMKKVNSIKEADALTADELRLYRLGGSSHKKAMLLYRQGMSYIEAKREIIKKNLILNQESNDLSLPGPHTSAESDTILSKEEVDANIKEPSTSPFHSPKMDLTDHGMKRPKSKDGSFQSPERKKLKFEEQDCEKVEIVHADYPKVILSFSKMVLVQKAILSAYDHLPINGPQIRFKKVRTTSNCLMITCADNITADWLKSIVAQLRPWKGAVLRVLNQNTVLKPVFCTVYVPDDDGERLSAERILDRLRVSNRGLNSHLWTVLSSTPSGPGQMWTFSMATESLDFLRKLNMTPYFGFGSLEFRLTYA